MQLERTMAGLEARLTPRARGRWIGAAFLGVWLCFWAAGEAFALWILIAGGWALLTGHPPEPGRAPLEIAPALLTGVFLLGWLAFWTFGGVMAGGEFLRLLWSVDRLVARTDGIELVRRRGPFTTRKFFSRDRLRGIYRLTSGRPSLQVETVDGVEELTRNGTLAEIEEVVKAFVAELQLPAENTLAPQLPDDWKVISVPDGAEVLVKNPATRRAQARAMWIIALPLAGVALVVLREAWSHPDYATIAAILTAVAGFAVWAAAWLTWTRGDEWRIEPGRIVLQRRRGMRVEEKFAGAALRLTVSRDDDGDEWFKIEVLGDAGAARKLQHNMHDPTTTRRLGQWLAARTGMSFADGAAPDIRARSAAERAAAQARMKKVLREIWTGWLRRLPGFSRD